MDILPEPNDAAPFLTKIPYLPHYSWEPWAKKGFLVFPLNHGFVDAAGKFKPQHDTSNMASMLQAWLFFGKLEESIGKAFKVEDFVKQDELGEDIITLAPLNKRKTYESSTVWPMKVEMERLLEKINFDPHSLAHLPYVFEIWHSIMWLWEVADLRSSIKAVAYSDQPFSNFDIPLDPFQRQSLSQLDRTQWCPFNRRRLRSLQSCTLRYVTSVPRRSFPPFLTHRNCSERSCTANAIDVETFQTRHVDDDCSCSFIGVSPGDLANICRQGSFPLVEIKPSYCQPQQLTNHTELSNPFHSIDISVRPWIPSSRFTAISHVWSHGLGNQQSNSLPICQLKKLALGVDRASHSRKRPRLFWMDILCIPVPDEYAAERRTSINKMGFIYAAAETVLVLDYELQRIPIKNMDKLQVLAHILTCSWMERAWTYNEGSLARSCFFQFADKMFDTQRMADLNFGDSPPKDFPSALRFLLDQDLSNQCLSEFGRKYGQASKAFKFDDTFANGWNALGRRSTSKPEDLLVILANLRGISLSHLSRFRAEEKLAVLISFQPHIPFTFLTTPNQSTYPCLSEPNRWIPRTIDGSYLSKDCLLVQRPSGDGLKLDHVYFQGRKKLIYLRLIMLPLSLNLSGDIDIRICANGTQESVRVKFLRESHPPLDHTSTMRFLVVKKGDESTREPNLPLMGCCLQLPDMIGLWTYTLGRSGKLCASLDKFLSEHHEDLRFTYDCPIRVEPLEDLSLLSHPGNPRMLTTCQPDEAHQVACPWTITIKSSMCSTLYTNSWNDFSEYHERTACRGDFYYWMQSAPYLLSPFLETIGLVSNLFLVAGLGFESYSSTVKAQVLDFARWQKCSYVAMAVVMARYVWLAVYLGAPYSVKRRLPLYNHKNLLRSVPAAYGLIADIFIFSFIFTSYRASRPSGGLLFFTTINTLINLASFIYHAVLGQIFARYLFNVWLATFQDDWSATTHNERWWTLLKSFGGSTPDTSFKDALDKFDRTRR